MKNSPPDLLISPNTEQAVMAGLFRSPDPSRALLNLGIDADLFALPAYRRIHHAMTSILADGLPLDYATLEQRLNPADLGELDDAVRTVVSDANLAVHARLLKECRDRRQQKTLRQQAAQALVQGADPSELQELFEAIQDPSLARVYARTRKDSKVTLISGHEIQPVAVRWLWDGWLAEGKIHLVAGPPGTGKTTMALALAATVSCGGRWPSGDVAQARNVVIWSGEDDLADTLRVRLEACGADMHRIRFVGPTSSEEGQRPFDPATDCVALGEALLKFGNVGLLLVDPISSAVGGDSHKNGEVRRALQPLVDLAIKTRCAVVGISHFSKATAGRDPVERVTGSIAFGALARVVMAVVKASDAQGGGRLLVRAKSNLGPDNHGYRFDLRQVELAAFPGVFGSLVCWGEAVQGDARCLIAQAERFPDDSDRSEVEEAKDFLMELLTNGPVEVRDIQGEAEGFGHSWRTIERAKKEVGVLSRREGFGKQGKFLWELPPSLQMNHV